MIRGIAWALLAALAMPVVPAQAQDTPARNGNVYNGTAHEPSPAAGNQGLSPQQQQQQNAVIEQLDRQVQKNAQTPTGTAAGCSASQKACPP